MNSNQVSVLMIYFCPRQLHPHCLKPHQLHQEVPPSTPPSSPSTAAPVHDENNNIVTNNNNIPHHGGRGTGKYVNVDGYTTFSSIHSAGIPEMDDVQSVW